MYTPLALVIGFFTGIVTGITGASGVMVVVPLAHMLLGLTVHQSIGTSLMADVIASIAVAYTYYRHGNTDIRSGFWVALGSIMGANTSAHFAVTIPGNSLGILFGAGMISTAVIIMRRGSGKEPERGEKQKKFRIDHAALRYAFATLLGYGLGTMTGIFGAGGGVMIFLVLFFILNFPVKKAIGTSTVIMSITAASGCIGYASHGQIHVSTGLLIGFSAVLGGFSSARIVNKIDEKYLIRAIALLFILMGIAMTTVGIMKRYGALPG